MAPVGFACQRQKLVVARRPLRRSKSFVRRRRWTLRRRNLRVLSAMCSEQRFQGGAQEANQFVQRVQGEWHLVRDWRGRGAIRLHMQGVRSVLAFARIWLGVGDTVVIAR